MDELGFDFGEVFKKHGHEIQIVVGCLFVALLLWGTGTLSTDAGPKPVRVSDSWDLRSPFSSLPIRKRTPPQRGVRRPSGEKLL